MERDTVVHLSSSKMKKPTKSEWIVVRKSSIHNKGVFAAKDIPKDTKVIEYVGDKISKEEGDKRCDVIEEKNKEDPSYGAVYVFELNSKFDIDGSVDWNTAKYINHSCDPNCEIEITGDHILVVALRDIKKGEEISYDYGYDFEDFEDHPCKCGAKNCVGFIVNEEDWPKLKKKLARKKARESGKLKREKAKEKKKLL